jgi:hypothetical protein
MRNDDFVTGFVSGTSIAPGAAIADTSVHTGNAVNFQQCDPEIAVIADVGAIGSSAVATVLLTQCATSGGSYTPVSGFSMTVNTASAPTIAMCISRQANYVKATVQLSAGTMIIGIILMSRLKIF